MLFDDEQLEGLCVAAASLARSILRDSSACGVLLGTQLVGGRRWAYLAPSAASGQLGRIEDLLARVEPIVSLPFEQLLAAVPRRLAPGGTVVVLSARHPSPYLEQLRRLLGSGYAVRFIATGDERFANLEAATQAGVAGSTAHLDNGWREAGALVMAG
jgi:hypothetical protein